MKRAYQKPEAEMIEFEDRDIICTSRGWPGYGWQDDNHDHTDPPGIGGWRPDKPGKKKGEY